MRARTTVALLLAAALGSLPAAGTEVKIFQTQNQAGFLAGTLEGVSVDSLGRMELAPKVGRVASLEEPFVFSSALHPDGWVIGTGNAGKVLKIDRKGKVTELLTAAEPEIFAVWADPDGTVFAGSSPQGKVYRIANGKSEVFFDPGQTYIWALARAADGGLLVATGTDGKLFKVDSKGRGQVLYDTDDTHVRSLEVLPGGDVLMGTAGEGLILRLSPNGQIRTLFDSGSPEVVALATAADGTSYAAVVSSEASLVDLSKPAAAPAAPGTTGTGQSGQGSGQATVTVETGDTAAVTTPGTRQGTGPRSEILSISPAGVVESIWSFNDDTVYDLLWRDGRLWVGTGVEGKLYSYADRKMLLEKDVDERQIVALMSPGPGGAGPSFATTNAAAVFQITAGTEQSGTYTSAALDSSQVSRFGTFRWRGDVPRRGAVRFSFRSGMSAEPDRTWSPWTEPKEGEELSLSDVPRGRYVQWRAELKAGDNAGSPQLYGTELSYRQENLRPKIDALVALDPGQILVPANFNPSNQVYEPAHPNRDGIFTSLTNAADDDSGGRTKPLWKKGFRTLRWTASDPNGDQLRYDLWFRPVDSPAAEKPGDDSGWLKVGDELKDDYYSFDSTVLPDGVYRFRLVASDQPSNEPDTVQTADRVSDPVVVDQSPPVLEKTERDGARLRVRVRDAASPIREAVYSLDATEWKPALPADGLLDGKTETLTIDPAKDGKAATASTGGLLLLRVTDAAFNVSTFNLSQPQQR